ncbi:HNH endonuclease [Pseudomonas sp. EZ-C24]|uniref:HNH endonuclease n=1 Tax=Pseudomonas sp. EZ-C24 TaxID=2753617 RepID=UPI001CB6FFBF|nr:HNH endonuclease [Pseudomonas sp. EZ-C24]
MLAKWAYISKKQDLLTQSGVGQSLGKAGFDDITGLAQMLLQPVETVKAIGGLIDDPSVLAGYPEEFKQNIKAKVARIENALTVGGEANAEQLGYDIGELVWDVGGLVTGVGGVAKGSVKLATVGIKLSTEKLEQMAERQVVKNLEWKAGKGDYSVKPGGGYDSPSTVTHNGHAVENAGDFSASLSKPAGKTEGAVDAKAQGSQAPYNSQTTRAELESIYGRDNVVSTTVPPIDGRNVHLAGQRHPVTGVVFDNKGFPIFDDMTAFDTRLPIDAFKSASYEGQMKLASKDLASAIRQGQVNPSGFTVKQLEQINAGAKKIDGYTWHHHQDSGRMQLVPELIHQKTGHIGGEAMGGGK